MLLGIDRENISCFNDTMILYLSNSIKIKSLCSDHSVYWTANGGYPLKWKSQALNSVYDHRQRPHKHDIFVSSSWYICEWPRTECLPTLPEVPGTSVEWFVVVFVVFRRPVQAHPRHFQWGCRECWPRKSSYLIPVQVISSDYCSMCSCIILL